MPHLKNKRKENSVNIPFPTKCSQMCGNFWHENILVYIRKYGRITFVSKPSTLTELIDNKIALFFQSNISLILHAVGEYDLSLKFLESSLALNIRFYGPKSLKVAVNYHLIARTLSCMGDFRSALANEKETYAIYKHQVGNFDITIETSRVRVLLNVRFVCSGEKNTIKLKNPPSAYAISPIKL